MNYRSRILTLLACIFFFLQKTELQAKDYSIYYTQKINRATLFDPDIKWEENFISSPNQGFDPQALWIKIKTDTVFRFLIIENAHLDTVQIFFYHHDRLIKTQLSGDRVPFSQRAVSFHYINFEIPDGTTTMFLRVKTEGSTGTPLLLIKKQEIEYFINHDKNNWTYFGILMFTFILNIIFGIYLKEKIYLYYCLYVLGIFFFFMVDFGYIFQLLYPDLPAINHFAPTFYGIFVLSYVFAEKYLGLKKKTYIRILFRIMYVLYALVPVLNYFDYGIAIKLVIINFMLTPLIILGTALTWYFKSRHKPVLIFIIAWSFYLFFLLIYSLASTGLFPYLPGIANFLLIGSILEVITLQFAVLYKINELREDNLENKLKVVALLEEKEKMLLGHNQKLENMVIERTQQLEATSQEVIAQNQMLQLQQQELEEQHEKLETQNELIEDVNNQLMRKHAELEEQVSERTKELRNINKELKEKNQRLEQFSYVAAHNLRGPVATLLGLTHLARIQLNRNIPVDEGKYFEDVEKTAHKLDTVISGLSLILDIEKNNDSLISSVALTQILSDVKVLLDAEIKESGCKIITEFKTPELNSIPIYLNNIFYNLISNTIKYKQEGALPEALIRSHTHDEKVIIEYSDNSLGIDLHQIGDKLFMPFKRFTDVQQGLGLGLYMIKVQTEAMEGTISLESSPGRGVKYTMEFK